MKPEELAVLFLEMRLGGVPHQLVNYYRWAAKWEPYRLDEAHRWIDNPNRVKGAWHWIESFGHHFEDADNLPKGDSWKVKPKK